MHSRSGPGKFTDPGSSHGSKFDYQTLGWHFVSSYMSTTRGVLGPSTVDLSTSPLPQRSRDKGKCQWSRNISIHSISCMKDAWNPHQGSIILSSPPHVDPTLTLIVTWTFTLSTLHLSKKNWYCWHCLIGVLCWDTVSSEAFASVKKSVCLYQTSICGAVINCFKAILKTVYIHLCLPFPRLLFLGQLDCTCVYCTELRRSQLVDSIQKISMVYPTQLLLIH